MTLKPSTNRTVWLAKLARLRETTATGKTGPSTEEILIELRAERGTENKTDFNRSELREWRK